MPYMAEAIDIPSPSAFLRADPPESPAKPTAAKHVRRQSAAETKKKAARKSGGPVSSGTDANVVKPKQKKSRNGTYTRIQHALS